MKTFIAISVLLLSTVSFAQQSLSPKCVGVEGVDQDKPFLVSVMGLTAKKAKTIAKSIKKEEILKLGNVLNFGDGFMIYEIGVNYSKIAVIQVIGINESEVINDMALSSILNIVSKNQPDSSKVAVECNRIADASPKAGGVN